jgi:hypothetical protein
MSTRKTLVRSAAVVLFGVVAASVARPAPATAAIAQGGGGCGPQCPGDCPLDPNSFCNSVGGPSCNAADNCGLESCNDYGVDCKIKPQE